MGLKDFILNGGLCGLMRGFDHKKEGRAYGFREFKEDAAEAAEVTCAVASVAGGKTLPSGKAELLKED